MLFMDFERLKNFLYLFIVVIIFEKQHNKQYKKTTTQKYGTGLHNHRKVVLHD